MNLFLSKKIIFPIHDEINLMLDKLPQGDSFHIQAMMTNLGLNVISTIGKLDTSTIIIQAIVDKRRYTIVCPCIASNYDNVALCSEDYLIKQWDDRGNSLADIQQSVLFCPTDYEEPTLQVIFLAEYYHEIQASSQSVPILRGSLIPLPSTSSSLIFQSCFFSFSPVFDHPVNQLVSPHELECRLTPSSYLT